MCDKCLVLAFFALFVPDDVFVDVTKLASCDELLYFSLSSVCNDFNYRDLTLLVNHLCLFFHVEPFSSLLLKQIQIRGRGSELKLIELE